MYSSDKFNLLFSTYLFIYLCNIKTGQAQIMSHSVVYCRTFVLLYNVFYILREKMYLINNYSNKI